jgi:hypothetical protein
MDREPPRVSFRSWQDPADPELVEARVSDRLSGPSVARGSIEVRRAGSGDRFLALATKVSGGRLRARWPSESHPAGEYEFRAIGHDAAGNIAVTTQRSDGAEMVLANPLKAPTLLRAGLRGRRTVPFGRRVVLSGRLSSRSGTPIEGVRVRVVERFDGGAATGQRITLLSTDADGGFSTRLPAGPSREIAAYFDGTAALGRSAAPAVDLDVRSDVRLRVSSSMATIGGRPVVFSGRVRARAGELPDGGKTVALQFRLPGLDWADFRTLHTDGRGRFRLPYRFSDDDSRGVRFQFRAYASPQGGWPYEPGGSRPVAVTGK